MMDIHDISRRALSRPSVYVPALTDEIQRIRRLLELYETAFGDIQTLCQNSGIWAVQNRIQALNTELARQTECSP